MSNQTSATDAPTEDQIIKARKKARCYILNAFNSTKQPTVDNVIYRVERLIHMDAYDVEKELKLLGDLPHE